MAPGGLEGKIGVKRVILIKLCSSDMLQFKKQFLNLVIAFKRFKLLHLGIELLFITYARNLDWTFHVIFIGQTGVSSLQS